MRTKRKNITHNIKQPVATKIGYNERDRKTIQKSE